MKIQQMFRTTSVMLMIILFAGCSKENTENATSSVEEIGGSMTESTNDTDSGAHSTVGWATAISPVNTQPRRAV